MPYYYAHEKRESDLKTSPDIEVWESGATNNIHDSPGCFWDSDPVGPFVTEAEALADARKGALMPYHHTDEKRESDPNVWHGWYVPSCLAIRVGAAKIEKGWFHGDQPDHVGPFSTKAEALADARKGVES